MRAKNSVSYDQLMHFFMYTDYIVPYASFTYVTIAFLNIINRPVFYLKQNISDTEFYLYSDETYSVWNNRLS
jgi:hypothetical protein